MDYLMRRIECLLSEKYRFDKAERAAKDIERILSGEPLDYVIGWAPFLGIAVDLSLHPFIPRPETEYWTKKAIEALKSRLGERPFRCLDMFAGSGCIGIAVLKARLRSRVVFVESSPRFIKQININLAKNRVSRSRFCVVASNLFQSVSGAFDVIVANPPYVGKNDILDPSVKKWESHRAYYAGLDGLLIIRKFLKGARDHLTENGEIWMEFGSVQGRAIQKISRSLGYARCEINRDHYGRLRYAVMQK